MIQNWTCEFKGGEASFGIIAPEPVLAQAKHQAKGHLRTGGDPV